VDRRPAGPSGRDSGLIRTARDEAAARGEGYATFVTEHLTAVLDNGLGRCNAALVALRRQGCRSFIQRWSPEGAVEAPIEAAVRSGEHELSELALDRLAETTSAAGHWRGCGVVLPVFHNDSVVPGHQTERRRRLASDLGVTLAQLTLGNGDHVRA
jgi:hypothetical protein